jgi:proteasome lid subunit RPN8/RPN11
MSWWPKRTKPKPAIQRPTVVLTTGLLAESARGLMQYRGPNGPHEGIVYWAGLSTLSHWIITSVILPKARTTSGSFRTSVQSNAETIGFLSDNGLELLAQVHSHPGTFVDHSAGDGFGALMPYENFLSVVVPNYAREGLFPLDTLGVHRFENGAFRRLSANDLAAALKVLPSCGDLRKCRRNLQIRAWNAERFTHRRWCL